MSRASETIKEMPRAAAVRGLRSGDRIKFERSVTINKTPAEIYAFWRQLENLPLFVTHLSAITANEDNTSHWEVQGEKGQVIGWDARIIEDKPNELLCWESLPGAEIQNAGCVRFLPAPGARGTVVRLTWSYVPGGGKFGAKIATLLNKKVVTELAQNLYNLRALLETGEVPTTQGQPQGGKSVEEQEAELAEVHP